VHFVQQPYRWLKAITDYGVTISVAPNFALDMCVDTVTDEEIQSLDLSALRQLYCGAEPVRKATLDRFSGRFAACGYRESAVIPCYGMAEATLFVSGKPDGTRPRSMRVDKAGLELGAVRAATARDGSAAEVMSCGRVAQGHEVVIVDPHTRAEAGPGAVGEIWVTGPSVAAGYAGRPDLAGTFTATVRGAGDTAYLRTGDLGYLHEGELYVTGRIKDVIIVAGRNLYPQDIEDTVLRSHGGLRKAAAFSVQPRSGEERLVVVAEVRRAGGWNESALSEVKEAVIAAVTAEHSVGLDDLYVGPPGTVSTTTSGKVRRAATRQGYERGSLKVLPERVGAVR
jgi:acyl-CoA synthetase (AMP-forming)/AMP-acid ligase II